MLNDLSVMCFVMESNDCAEVFESGYATLAEEGRVHTQFQVLLWTAHELTDSGREAF
jgi:hypothetical protein